MAETAGPSAGGAAGGGASMGSGSTGVESSGGGSSSSTGTTSGSTPGISPSQSAPVISGNGVGIVSNGNPEQGSTAAAAPSPGQPGIVAGPVSPGSPGVGFETFTPEGGGAFVAPPVSIPIHISPVAITSQATILPPTVSPMITNEQIGIVFVVAGLIIIIYYLLHR